MRKTLLITYILVLALTMQGKKRILYVRHS